MSFNGNLRSHYNCDIFILMRKETIPATSCDWRLLKLSEAVRIFQQTFCEASILPSIEVWEIALQHAAKKGTKVTIGLIGSDESWSLYMVDTTWLAVETLTGATYPLLYLPDKFVAKLPFSLKNHREFKSKSVPQYS